MTENTFEELDKTTEEVSEASEMDINQFDDTPVGNRKAYKREPLDGKVVTVEKFVIEKADTTKAPQSALTGDSKYWTCSACITYDVKNAEGVNHREYVSGAKQFVDRNGQPSNMNFWYEGVMDKPQPSQIAKLWVNVAKALEIEPKDMSPRQFVAFLNSKPKAKLAGEKYQFPGSPEVTKNMVGEFIRA